MSLSRLVIVEHLQERLSDHSHRPGIEFGAWTKFKSNRSPGPHRLRSSGDRSCRRDTRAAPLLPVPRGSIADGSAPARRRVLPEPSRPKRLVSREATPRAWPLLSSAAQSWPDISTTILRYSLARQPLGTPSKAVHVRRSRSLHWPKLLPAGPRSWRRLLRQGLSSSFWQEGSSCPEGSPQYRA